ncbi:MAG: penicillin acylase family protein [Nitriliruptorales bacterium]
MPSRRRVLTRHVLTAAVAAVLLALAPVGAGAQDSPVTAYRHLDESAVARNVLPPGQGRYLNLLEYLAFEGSGSLPERNSDQIALYEDLVAAAPELTPSDLDTLFKDASFGVPEGEVADEYAPRDGVTVLRDGFGAPHVYGQTREDTMFGVGYVSAEDRLFMMDVLRHVGRGRLSEFLGASEANLASDRAQRKGADYSEEELLEMANRVAELDPELGPLARADLENYVEGINAFIAEAIIDRTKLPAEYDALQQLPREWQLTDPVATATLIGATFSPGGGGQLANAAVLQELQKQGHSAAEARAILDDLRMANDPEAPTTIDTPFPFLTELGEPQDGANVVPDDAAAVVEAMSAAALPTAVDGPFGKIPLAATNQASNALLVSSQLSEDGRALAVFGPQVGYWSPEILMELDMHGPGLHARGAAFPGVSLYVLLGRGTNYAWSATTAIGDHRDIRAVELCDPEGGEADLESTHYLDDGECVEMETRTDTWLAKPSAAGFPPEFSEDAIVVQETTERTRHGIVQTRAMADGKPHAFVLQRSSYGKEVDATLTYTAIHDPERMRSIEDLKAAFVDHFSYSFNWFLVHGDDIGYQLTGHYPQLPVGVDPDLPISGDSRWDPVGRLRSADIPNATNPEKGFITNWNGKQAPQWRASDDNWAFGPTQRVQLLDAGVERALSDDGRVSLTELTRAMGIAATQDLYAVQILPLLLDVVGTPDDPELAEAVGLLREWADSGGHRRDLDGDGEYDVQAPIVLFDEWWGRATEAIFRPVLGDAFDQVPLALSEKANPQGSAYWGAWHGQISKDLRQILDRPVDGPMSRTYCGAGDLEECRTALRVSLDAALDAVVAEFGEDPSGWDVDESAEQIAFEAVGVVGLPSMHWQNRPTFQQVLAFGDGAELASPEPVAPARAPLPTTGGGVGLLGLVAVGLAALLRRGFGGLKQ